MARGVALPSVELDTNLADATGRFTDSYLYPGTTGQPKGVMLDYTNVGYQPEGHDERLSLTRAHERLSCTHFLSHVFERKWTFYVLYKGATNCYPQDTMQVRDVLSDVADRVMCAYSLVCLY